MPKVSVYNMEGQTVGEIELSDEVFAAEVNEPLLHEAVVAYLANQRQGTVGTKTRAEVRGGGRKPWRQKGLGRARHGSIRSPLWVGGGTVFGPKPREYRLKMNKKARRQALRSALSGKVRDGALVVVDELQLAEPKTRTMVGILSRLGAGADGALIVTRDTNENVQRAARNIEGVNTAAATGLNVYQIMAHAKLVMTRDAVAAVEEVLA